MSSSGLETIPPSGLCRGDFGLVDIDHNLSCFASEPLPAAARLDSQFPKSVRILRP